MIALHKDMGLNIREAFSFYGALNSATLGVSGFPTNNQARPFTIAGQNITAGVLAPVEFGNGHLLKGINATKSIHCYQVTGNESRAEILG